MLSDLLRFDFLDDVRKISDHGTYFRGIDVCNGFGYYNPKEEIRDYVSIKNKRIFREIDFYHEADAIYLNIHGVYQLLLNSGIEFLDDIPNLEEFES